ncbi:ribosomal large subunit pseudouridine synthase D [Natranaerovirga hydrolytica]|uniref:RNA pseudouridylate synthase n=1 Tax=Natranaerovirga hydrolytica TaxID=680378 RepID=A0A4R1MTH2_9FIRM|nr:RluA family pseudouridine synthase [Natranaerovirga hydrolytica]TCK93263.1 ribosomal large subunit pseudouridine synthase D [Natranaerovirga hydrolytica]
MDFEILFEDQHVIVVTKPPKVPSQKDKTNDMDLLSMIKEYLKKQYTIKEPYVALMHRLDRPVGGAMVYSKTKYASKSLSEQIQQRKISKQYVGVVCNRPEEEKGTLKDYLIKDGGKNVSKVVKGKKGNAKEAILEYKVLKTHEDDEKVLALVEFNLITGRHHQIRVQTANAGWPLWGDTKYNKIFSNNKEWTQIALWAKTLSFYHPKTKKLMSFESQLPKEYPFSIFNEKGRR